MAVTGTVDGPPVLRRGARPGDDHLGHRAAGGVRRRPAGAEGARLARRPAAVAGRGRGSGGCPRPAPTGAGRGGRGPPGRGHRHDRRFRRPAGRPGATGEPVRRWVSSWPRCPLPPVPPGRKPWPGATITCWCSRWRQPARSRPARPLPPPACPAPRLIGACVATRPGVSSPGRRCRSEAGNITLGLARPAAPRPACRPERLSSGLRSGPSAQECVTFFRFLRPYLKRPHRLTDVCCEQSSGTAREQGGDRERA